MALRSTILEPLWSSNLILDCVLVIYIYIVYPEIAISHPIHVINTLSATWMG